LEKKVNELAMEKQKQEADISDEEASSPNCLERYKK